MYRPFRLSRALPPRTEQRPGGVRRARPVARQRPRATTCGVEACPVRPRCADLGRGDVYRLERQNQLSDLLICIAYMSATIGAGFPADRRVDFVRGKRSQDFRRFRRFSRRPRRCRCSREVTAGSGLRPSAPTRGGCRARPAAFVRSLPGAARPLDRAAGDRWCGRGPWAGSAGMGFDGLPARMVLPGPIRAGRAVLRGRRCACRGTGDSPVRP